MNSSSAAVSPAHSEVGRAEIHLRRIEMRGFSRSDGLYEIEGRLSDRKTHAFVRPGDGHTVPANVPIHDMGVRLVFDGDMVVRSVETFTLSAPYAACPEGGHALKSLTGLRIGRGWSQEVRSRLGGASSCTHLRELLPPMASAALQAVGGLLPGKPLEEVDGSGRPIKIDSCYAYAASGEVVLHRWPQYHRTPTSNE
ncbi:DUF2889 domain-containing protein [Variovorax saccharolyticus]|uniref:DUF2889 domain-containing protein n=1 Tax=Variovorax saccharolyticus TaxID=3053516 RepID=UPI002577757D|nr:DUF2889 domain-containing protein [Variovorax sp. J22R187]MDM0021776.1 DUF2889 domain-containing protein [Variovorax sp. J22R187]